MTPRHPDLLYLGALLGTRPHSSAPYYEAIVFLYKTLLPSLPKFPSQLASNGQFFYMKISIPNPPTD